MQVQLTFSIAPAPAPAALTPGPALQLDRPEVAAPIKPVSTPVLTAIEPIAGDALADAKTVAQDVRSEVDGIESAVPDIVASFKGRKLLATDAQVNLACNLPSQRAFCCPKKLQQNIITHLLAMAL